VPSFLRQLYLLSSARSQFAAEELAPDNRRAELRHFMRALRFAFFKLGETPVPPARATVRQPFDPQRACALSGRVVANAAARAAAARMDFWLVVTFIQKFLISISFANKAGSA